MVLPEKYTISCYLSGGATVAASSSSVTVSRREGEGLGTISETDQEEENEEEGDRKKKIAYTVSALDLKILQSISVHDLKGEEKEPVSAEPNSSLHPLLPTLYFLLSTRL